MPTPTSAVKVNPVTGALIDPPVATFAAANGLLTTGSSDAKNSVRAATTANGTLATAFANGQTVDGIALVTSDRILLKNQTAQAENGIYTVNASGAPTRATDFDAWDEIIGAFVTVESGTVNAGTQWLCNVVAGGTLGTTAITFVVPKNFVDLTTTQTISGAKAFTSTSSTYSGLTIRNSPGFLVDSCYLSIGGTGTNISFFSSFTTTGAIEFVGSYNSTFTLTGTTALTFPTSGTILSSTNIGVSVQAYDADLTTWAGITPAAGVGTFLATPSGANLASALTSALTVAKGGTGLTAGTSGGILAFTATGTIASSGLLAANALMIGGGAGVVPSTTTTGAGVLTALGIAPNASGGFSTLRKFSGSASLNNITINAGEIHGVAITVTGAAAGDSVSLALPIATDQGQACVSAIEVTTNLVTVYLYAAPDSLGIPADAGWTASGNTIYASIIK